MSLNKFFKSGGKARTMREFFKNELEDQKRWIRDCGGDLAGYIARYGDPGIACTTGPRAGLPMYGEGGTAIYNADVAQLRRLERSPSLRQLL